MSKRKIESNPKRTCHLCGKTDNEPGYECAFCEDQWEHYSCGCECTECRKPGAKGKMCKTCKETFGNKDEEI